LRGATPNRALLLWLTPGLGIWLIGINLPQLRNRHVLRRIIAGCGTIARAGWVVLMSLPAIDTMTIATLRAGSSL